MRKRNFSGEFIFAQSVGTALAAVSNPQKVGSDSEPS